MQTAAAPYTLISVSSHSGAATAAPCTVADLRQNTSSLPSRLVALHSHSMRVETQPCIYNPTYYMPVGRRERSCHLSDAKRSAEPPSPSSDP
ncbi:hypothetical protein LX32DRAFT_634982 [Colletotrichum zoysiae]|uniref:Uncharacterized protein n=1 Tax=Colletotrichum zoysiae TaxID=1216348 RepID=A0AAD9HRS1_9PEZI|nr:hypothetical protein LX32DRAFT_634982 [Colletotrichum zoysiae]